MSTVAAVPVSPRRVRRGEAWRRAALPSVGAWTTRAIGATLRLTVVGIDRMRPLWRAGTPLIYVIWHGRILMAPWVNERLRRSAGARAATVLTSRSRDGEMVARYAAQFGLPVVRGSTSRGGGEAMRALTAALRSGEDVVIVPDGPRGPARQLGAGVVTLAALTGAPVVPLAFAARPAWTLATWDRFQIPWPFARATAMFGAPVAVPRSAGRDDVRRVIETALDDLTHAADRLCGGGQDR